MRKLSTQKVILRWKMKTVYQSFTISKRFIQVPFYYQLLENELPFSVMFLSLFCYLFFVCLTPLCFLLDEWTNFMERIGCTKDQEVWENEENILLLRHWASLRGQTLCRTGTLNTFSYHILLDITVSYRLFIVTVYSFQ